MQKGMPAPLHEKSVIGSVSHFTKILKRPNFISPFIYKIHVRFYAKRDTRSALFRAMRVSLIFYPIRMRLRPRSAEPAAHRPRRGHRRPRHPARSASRIARTHGPGTDCRGRRWPHPLPADVRCIAHIIQIIVVLVQRDRLGDAVAEIDHGHQRLRFGGVGAVQHESRSAPASTTAAKIRFFCQLFGVS